jgi:hypothetical protein
MSHEVPMPDQAHPSLANYADFVRQWKRSDPIRIPRLRRLMAYDLPAGETPEPVEPMLDPIVLTCQKVAAPAPFVARHYDDQAGYIWYAWGDGNNRYITTAAELVWR